MKYAMLPVLMVLASTALAQNHQVINFSPIPTTEFLVVNGPDQNGIPETPTFEVKTITQKEPGNVIRTDDRLIVGLSIMPNGCFMTQLKPKEFVRISEPDGTIRFHALSLQGQKCGGVRPTLLNLALQYAGLGEELSESDYSESCNSSTKGECTIRKRETRYTVKFNTDLTGKYEDYKKGVVTYIESFELKKLGDGKTHWIEKISSPKYEVTKD